MDPRETYDRRDELLVLDVREPHEWDAGHIAGALHIPMGELNDRQDEIDQERTIVAVCRSGARSGRVAAALGQAGYDVHNLDGGMQAWDRADLPFVAADGSEGSVA